MSQKKVLVLGGGIAGISAALDLAAGGCYVYLAEKNNDLGGNAALYVCKATDRCEKCGACSVVKNLEGVKENPSIEVHRNISLKQVERIGAEYKLKFDNGSNERTFIADAVVVATGFKPFDAAEKTEYGYGLYPGIMSAYDLEKALRSGGVNAAVPLDVSRIAFIQCVGGEIDTPGGNCCCQDDCLYSSRMAKLLWYHRPDLQLDIYYTDLQNFGKGFKEYKEDCEEQEIVEFIHGRPAKVYGYPGKGLLLKHESPLTGEQVERPYDRVILCTSSCPGDDTNLIADMMGLELNEDGFIKGKNTLSDCNLPKGIYPAGACTGPMDIASALREGKRAAGDILADLK